ncbi:MAG: hypothetical protein ACOYKM_04085 [Caulobacterales bacterium]
MVSSFQVGMAKALAIGAAALAMTGCGQPAVPVERSAPMEMPAAVPVAAEPTVASGESWTCTYMGYAIRENEAPRPVIVRFTVEGEELVEGSFGQRYRILQNNQYALIAAWSIAEIEPTLSEPSIASWSIVIDKRNGFFSRVNLIAEQGLSGAARDGSCIRD